MKQLFLTVFTLCFVATLSAQIDNNRGFGTPIQAQESSSTNPHFRSSQPQGISNNRSFLTTRENKTKLDDKEETLDMNTDTGLIHNKFDYNPSWLTKDREERKAHRKDQNLGTFGTKSKTIEILCRDNQYVDGDRVRILVNDQVVIHNINLREDFQSFEIDLTPGPNVIQFQALNQGTSGPNTAHFKVYDEKGQITESEWNLLTGAKGNLVILYEVYE